MQSNDVVIDIITENLHHFSKQCLKTITNEIDNEDSDLYKSIIRKFYNEVLDNCRSGTLARSIKNYLKPDDKIIDIMCGTGTLTKALENAGYNIEAVERESALYGVKNFEYKNYDENCSLGHYDVSLLITVLHHEEKYWNLLELAMAHSDKIIIVENVIDKRHTQEIHEKIDEFFNRMLNQFSADCPGKHLSDIEWRILLSTLQSFKLTRVEKIGFVPGIPVPHYLYVLERECNGKKSSKLS
ncbi:hypothetical protein ABW286_12525 [Erwinia papayae]|uniref:Class I SAM-dependent methyltransferase n=1 Tax=Erwinia papayae TaxID=206499 RepID=A0ABV3N2F4_9GAMM